MIVINFNVHFFQEVLEFFKAHLVVFVLISFPQAGVNPTAGWCKETSPGQQGLNTTALHSRQTSCKDSEPLLPAAVNQHAPMNSLHHLTFCSERAKRCFGRSKVLCRTSNHDPGKACHHLAKARSVLFNLHEFLDTATSQNSPISLLWQKVHPPDGRKENEKISKYGQLIIKNLIVYHSEHFTGILWNKHE